MTLDMHPDPNSAWAELGVEPGVVLRAFGMRRAGNHAVINWLLRNAPSEHTIFLNNCIAGRNPLRSFKTLEINGEHLVPNGEQKVLADFASQADEGATLLISYEDLLPNRGTVNRDISADFDEDLIGGELIIYRSFMNWAASLVKKLLNNPGYKQAHRINVILRAIEMYAATLEMALHQSKLNLVAICYDDWLNDAKYRADVLAQLEFSQKDDNLGDVQPYGGGSSFQPDEEDVGKLGTDRRWQQMARDPVFQIVLWLTAQDDTLMERLEIIFPEDADRLRTVRKTFEISSTLDTGETS